VSEHPVPWWRWLSGTLLSCLLATHLQAQSPAETRVALVIGNAAYAQQVLDNPTHDADAVAGTLARLGFIVIRSSDASKARMEAAIAQAREALQGRRGVGLFYYAGHALQLEWRNFLVPVDARLTSARDVPSQTVDLQKVLDAFQAAGTRMNIVVLDACRDNPFGATGRGNGLAPMDAPWGTFLAYATAPGNVAEDGLAEGGGNSLYTKYLVQELAQPAARIEDVFKRVRLQVRQKTEGRQIPWESTSLEEEFYFDRSLAPSPAKATAAPDSTDIVRAAQAETADWQRIAKSTRPDDFYAFLRKHPSGLTSELALFRLSQLQAERVRVSAGPDGVVRLPAGTDRYVKGDVLVMERIDEFAGTSRELRWEVTHADRDRVEINSGAIVHDQMGSTLRDSSGIKHPPVLLVPADIARGKRWRSPFNNTDPKGRSNTGWWDNKVVALEDVDVPAGRFRAYRVERSGWLTREDGRVLAMTGSLWIDPSTMLWVRSDRESRVNGKPVERVSTRLKSLQRSAQR
jgi:hypothetical protein